MGVGRKKKPDSLKVLQGTFRKGRADKSGFAGGEVSPEPPEHLCEIGRAMYRRVAAMTGMAGVSKDLDEMAIEQIAEVYAEWRQACEIIRAEGPYYTTVTATGGEQKKPHPLLSSRAIAARRFHSLLVEFGLTPASRSKVSAGGLSDDEDDLAAQYGF